MKWHGRVDTGNGDYQYLERMFQFMFVWDNGPTYDGLSTTTTWIQPNGLYQTVLDHGCQLDPWARVFMLAWVAIGQYNPNGEFAWLEEQPPLVIFDRTQRELNGAAVYIYPVLEARDEIPITTGSYPVVKDYPIVTIVILLMAVSSGDGGEAELNFSGGDLRVNVPSVWHVVD
jgi:hypothetical protein